MLRDLNRRHGALADRGVTLDPYSGLQFQVGTARDSRSAWITIRSTSQRSAEASGMVRSTARTSRSTSQLPSWHKAGTNKEKTDQSSAMAVWGWSRSSCRHGSTGQCRITAVTPAEATGEPQPKPLDLSQYEPKSMLQVHESQVARAKYPVIDFHTHISVSAKSEKGVELSPRA